MAPVPIDAPLDLEGRLDSGTARLGVARNGHPLASAAIGAIDRGAPCPETWRGADGGWALPTSETCLACGTENPLGLQAGLRFDDEGVWARLDPQPAWRTAEGTLHPAAGPVLLDEVAWWIGALFAREGGVTNRLRVTLYRPDLPRGPLWAAGRFDRVTPVDRHGAFWRAEPALFGADGALLATASIVFRSGAAYGARQMGYFRSRTPPGLFRRMFPGYAS